MNDLERILTLWRELETAGADYALATVVAVEGSSYRKPGACMMITPDGRRVGTVSGGCLEGQVASRAWWLTANGPTIQRFSTQEEDGDRPYGSGCGGVVYLLLERRATASPLLAALDEAFNLRSPVAVATTVGGPHLALRYVAGLRDCEAPHVALQELAETALANRTSTEETISIEGVPTRAWADYRSPRPGLRIFGAGDDAQPLVRLAKALGWFVSVADGRSHLATRERFPLADQVGVLPIQEMAEERATGSLPPLNTFQERDAAVLMTHSFEQDTQVLAALFAQGPLPAYVGVLGPQRRTRELLAEAARLLRVPQNTGADQVEHWLGQLHAPTGLDLGAESPEAIALSILAEVQQCLTAASALPLRQVRTAR